MDTLESLSHTKWECKYHVQRECVRIAAFSCFAQGEEWWQGRTRVNSRRKRVGHGGKARAIGGYAKRFPDRGEPHRRR